MAEGARLRHPSLCLLSPGLMAWGCTLWKKEKGPKVVSVDKQRRIREITLKLYDHQANEELAKL